MAINDFKPFATRSNANVLSQADYEKLAAVNGGFQAGIARSSEINKVLRQATTIASALAQVCADEGLDMQDDGQIERLAENIKNVFIISNLDDRLAQKADKATTLAGYGIVDGVTQSAFNLALDKKANKADLLPLFLPAGLLGYFAMTKQPAGWLKANGALIKIAVYQTLFDAIGHVYCPAGVTPPAGYFYLPDLRGEFVRGWDNGRLVDAGREMGSFQDCQLEDFILTSHHRRSDRTFAMTAVKNTIIGAQVHGSTFDSLMSVTNIPNDNWTTIVPTVRRRDF